MEQIEYSRTVVPSSMRSPYWKYFGFPSDSSNNILTRQKVVCTICNTTIAYNKNTSNLRTHLMSKHVEVLKKIVSSTNAFVAQKYSEFCENSEEHSNSNNIKFNELGKNQNFKRHCIEVLHSGYNFSSSSQGENNSSSNYTNLPVYKRLEDKSHSTPDISAFHTNSINFETQGTDFVTYFPPDVTQINEVAVPNEEFKADNEKINSFNNVGIHEDHEQQLHSMDIMLADYIQTDLLPLETLQEYGFCKYNQQLTGLKIDNNTITRIKSIIETRFTNIKEIVTDRVTRLSQSTPYSLSFEIYKNNEEQDILNIYFNYLNDEKEDLISILYISSTIFTKYANISELLEDINLNNCSGVVINFLKNEFQFVLDFANIHELPLIECLDSLVTRCLQKIFQQTEFYADYKHFAKTILKNENVIPPAKSNLKSTCKWNPLIILEYIFNNVKQEKVENWDELRESFEYLKPLKDALDVIMDERIPLCSLIRPLMNKLFEDNIISKNQKKTCKYQIQKILEKELYERIFANTFLKEVTFFDIRFHRYFILNDSFMEMTSLKSEISKRFKNILQVTYVNKTINVGMEQHSTDDSVENIGKCSRLKSFFKRDVALRNTTADLNLKSNLDLEFEQYCRQECLDLDQSPILWWEQQSNNYKQLAKIANFYLTIPCCYMPRLCRINLEEKCLKLDRRKNLSQFCNIESKLWFLYYNENVAEFF